MKFDSSSNNVVSKQLNSPILSQPSLIDQIEYEMKSKQREKENLQKNETTKLILNNNFEKSKLQKSTNFVDSHNEEKKIELNFVEKSIMDNQPNIRASQRSTETQIAEFVFDESGESTLTVDEALKRFSQPNVSYQKKMNQNQGIRTGWQEIKEQRETFIGNQSSKMEKNENKTIGVSQLVKQV